MDQSLSRLFTYSSMDDYLRVRYAHSVLSDPVKREEYDLNRGRIVTAFDRSDDNDENDDDHNDNDNN